LPLVLCVWLIFLLIIVFIEYLCYTIYMRKDNLIRGRTCVYNVNYHIVWSVKYRRKVLTAEVEAYLKNVIQDIAQEKGFEIAECEVGENDHVHVFVSAHPKIAPSYIAKMLKGISGRRLFLKYPEITKKTMEGSSLKHYDLHTPPKKDT